MKKYYINLDFSIKRKEFMEKNYENIIRIEAYNGKNLKKYNDIILPKECEQTNNELACSLSHIKAIITAYNNNDNEALIFEDDTNDDQQLFFDDDFTDYDFSDDNYSYDDEEDDNDSPLPGSYAKTASPESITRSNNPYAGVAFCLLIFGNVFLFLALINLIIKLVFINDDDNSYVLALASTSLVLFLSFWILS